MAYTTIDDPSAHFQIALYTGQGGTATAVTNDGNSDLQPDLIFFKSRTTTARWNVMDSTRGNTKVLYAEGNDAEAEMIEKSTGLAFLGNSTTTYSEPKNCVISGKPTHNRVYLARTY